MISPKLASVKALNEEQDAELHDLDTQMQGMEEKLLDIALRKRMVTVARERGYEEVKELEGELERKRGEVENLEHALVILERRPAGGGGA